MARNYITVDVEVYLDEFIDDDLIKELQDRGYTINGKNEEDKEDSLDSLEREIVANAFINCKPGTIGNFIYEKMRKR